MRSLGYLAAIILLTFKLPAAVHRGRIPIILDTDIGTDIDDAFALALVLRSPEFDLVGVTTVSGDTQARARIAGKMLWEAGRRGVPVAAGRPGKPLPIEQARWAEGFTSPQILTEGAAEFLIREIERRPGELTLVPIGPLTNVSDLLKQHPEVAKRTKRIVLMGGSIALGYEPGSGAAAEYNIASDIEAARAVFASGIPIVMAPLDVTAMLQLDRAGRKRVFEARTPLSSALSALYRFWGRETPTLFDPMAVALVIEPSLCEMKDLAIRVDQKGFTRVESGQTPNAKVAVRTNPRRFFEFYLRRVAPSHRRR